MYENGDIVLVNGNKSCFFEVVNVTSEKLTLSNSQVQIKRPINDVDLICKAGDRKDKKVPYNWYWSG